MKFDREGWMVPCSVAAHNIIVPRSLAILILLSFTSVFYMSHFLT